MLPLPRAALSAPVLNARTYVLPFGVGILSLAMEKFDMRCNDQKKLLDVVRVMYPSAVILNKSGDQTHVRFSCGLVMNVYETKTVTFQGNDVGSATKEDLIRIIEKINLSA